MSISVKFLTGKEENLPLEISDGSVYFAITDEEENKGLIYFDNNGSRYLMSSPSSDVAKKVEHTLTIGDFKYNGSEDVTVPIYNGEKII